MTAVTAPLRKRPLPPASRRTRQHLYVVDEPVTRHTLAYAVVLLLLAAAIVFGAVTLNALAAGAAVEARNLDAHVVAAERHHGRLVAEVAALEDPARIRAAALDLGLVPSGPLRYVVVERNLPTDGAAGSAFVPGAATDPLKPLLSAGHR